MCGSMFVEATGLRSGFLLLLLVTRHWSLRILSLMCVISYKSRMRKKSHPFKVVLADSQVWAATTPL